KMRHTIKGVRRGHQVRRAQRQPFDAVVAKVFIEPGSPHRPHRIAWLQHRAHPRTRATTHEAEVPAVLARQQLGDDASLAVPPHAQDDAVVSPLHTGYSPSNPALFTTPEGTSG